MMNNELKQEILSILVLNQANVLSRVVNMFGRRGFNIDSLTVSPTNDPALSRITVAVTGTENKLQQILLQTEKLEVVKSIYILTKNNSLYRELLLIKINCTKEERDELINIVSIYEGKIDRLSKDHMLIELTGRPDKIDAFLDLVDEYDVAEVCRTGLTAIESGAFNIIKAE